mmetsp:Transcript_151966/g.487799  ORF Transcript_151966/g.487799 Transcript_151966/m.487799 type:complete len:492 (-) Transcript_151966:1802-3277(-)
MVRSCSQSIAASGEVERSSWLHNNRTSSSDRLRRRTSTSSRAVEASPGSSPPPSLRDGRSLAEACTMFWLPRVSGKSPMSTSRSAAGSANFCFITGGTLSASISCIFILSKACADSCSFSWSSSIAPVSPSSSSSPSFSVTPSAWFGALAMSVHSPSASAPSLGSAMCKPCSAPAFCSSLAAGASLSSAPRRRSTFCRCRSEASSGVEGSGCVGGAALLPALDLSGRWLGISAFASCLSLAFVMPPCSAPAVWSLLPCSSCGVFSKEVEAPLVPPNIRSSAAGFGAVSAPADCAAGSPSAGFSSSAFSSPVPCVGTGSACPVSSSISAPWSCGSCSAPLSPGICSGLFSSPSWPSSSGMSGGAAGSQSSSISMSAPSNLSSFSSPSPFSSSFPSRSRSRSPKSSSFSSPSSPSPSSLPFSSCWTFTSNWPSFSGSNSVAWASPSSFFCSSPCSLSSSPSGPFSSLSSSSFPPLSSGFRFLSSFFSFSSAAV